MANLPWSLSLIEENFVILPHLNLEKKYVFFSSQINTHHFYFFKVCFFISVHYVSPLDQKDTMFQMELFPFNCIIINASI